MTDSKVGGVLQYLRRMVRAPDAGETTDRQLLGRFAQRRDADAFTELVGRHGALVLSVCRRVLHDDHAAEDALQATFMVLAAKAGAVGWQESIAGWLQAVAFRVASNHKAGAARRQQHERQAPAMPSSDLLADVTARELRQVLDEELALLPEKYRAPLVLCCLEGKSNEEAARLLGRPAGTVSGQLTRARDLLRGRLAQRGLALSAAACVVGLAQCADAAPLPVALVRTIVQAAVLGPSKGDVAAPVDVLTQGVLKAMFVTKLKIAALILVVVGIGGGAGWLGYRTLADGKATTPVALVPLPEDGRKENVEPKASEPVEKDGLAVTIKAAKAAFAENEPLVFTVNFKNISTKTFRLFDADWTAGYKMRMAGVQPQNNVFVPELGKPVERRKPQLDDSQPLEPGKSRDVRLVLDEAYVYTTNNDDRSRPSKQLPPGKYRLTATIQLEDCPFLAKWSHHHWIGAITTKGAEFEIGAGLALPRVPQAPVENEAPSAEKVDPPPHNAGPVDVDGDPLPNGALARMGTPRWQHGSPVSFIAFTNEGKLLVTGSQDGFFRTWNVATARVVRKFGRTIDNATISVRLSPDGKFLAAHNSLDSIVHLYDVAEGKETKSFRVGPAKQPASRVVGMAFAPDGKSLVTVLNSGMLIRQWDLDSAKEIRQFGQPSDARRPITLESGNSLAFSGDGKQLALSGVEEIEKSRVGFIQVFEVETGKELRTIKGQQSDSYGSIAFAPNGKVLAWAAPNGAIRLINAADGKELKWIDMALRGSTVRTLVFSPDSKMLATRVAGGSDIFLWEVESGKEVHRLGGRSWDGNRHPFLSDSRDIAFSPDGKTLAEGLTTNTVRLYEVDNGKEIRPVSGHQGGVSDLAVAPDGKTLITRGFENTLRHWDLASGRETFQAKLPVAGMAVFSANGQVIAFGGANNTVHIWDAIKGKEISTITSPGSDLFSVGGMGGLALSPDGKILVAAHRHEAAIRLYEVASGRALGHDATKARDDRVLINYSGGRMTFSPDGKVLATPGALESGGPITSDGRVVENRLIRLWSVSNAKQIRQFEIQDPGVSALILSQDGRKLVSLNNDKSPSVSILELATGRERCRFKTGSQHIVTLSSDSRTLATVGDDHIIRLWDIRTGRELGQFKGHQGAVRCLTFAPDGTTLISGSLDTTALVWDARPLIAKNTMPLVDLNAQQVEVCWTDLAGADGNKAQLAINALSAAPKQTVPWLKDKLKPVVGVESKKTDQLVAELGSNDFTVRQEATEELEKLGELAEPALTKVLEGNPALETRQRIEKLLQRLEPNQPPPPEVLRGLRAIEVLEHLATPEAKALIQTVAKGAPGARLTVESQKALDRLATPEKN